MASFIWDKKLYLSKDGIESLRDLSALFDLVWLVTRAKTANNKFYFGLDWHQSLPKLN